jgi:hypothetical protein
MPVVVKENVHSVHERNSKIIHVPSNKIFFQSFPICSYLIHFD